MKFVDDIEYLVSEHQHSGPGVHSYVVRELTVRHENPTKWADKRQAPLVLIETETEDLDTVWNFLLNSTSEGISSIVGKELDSSLPKFEPFFSPLGKEALINWWPVQLPKRLIYCSTWMLEGAFTHYKIQPDFILQNIGPLFSQLLFSIVLMVTGWITGRMGSSLINDRITGWYF